jgi:hypothetical protein
MSEKGYNTNLAAEFYVLSMLHRLGANALLTLGNKKAVDILVEKNGKSLTIDVKGLTDKTSFPVDNYRAEAGHYIAFVSFLNKIGDPAVQPEVYIVPSLDIKKQGLLFSAPSGAQRVQYKTLSENAGTYPDKWRDLLS